MEKIGFKKLVDQDLAENADQIISSQSKILNESSINILNSSDLVIKDENTTLDNIVSDSFKELFLINQNTTFNNTEDLYNNSSILIDEIFNSTKTFSNNDANDYLNNDTFIIDEDKKNMTNLNDTYDSLINNTIIIVYNDTMDSLNKDTNDYLTNDTFIIDEDKKNMTNLNDTYDSLINNTIIIVYNDTMDYLYNETDAIEDFFNNTNYLFNNTEDSLTTNIIIIDDLDNNTGKFMNNTDEQLNEVNEATSSYLNNSTLYLLIINETSTTDSIFSDVGDTNSSTSVETQDPNIINILNAIQNLLNQESNDILNEFENYLLNISSNNSSINGLELLSNELEKLLDKFKNLNISSPPINNALEIFHIFVSNLSELNESLTGVTDINNASICIMNLILRNQQNETFRIYNSLSEYYKLVSPKIYEYIQESSNFENLIQNLMIYFAGNITETKEPNLYLNVFTLILSSSVLDYNSFINQLMTTKSYNYNALIPIDDLGPILNDTIIMTNIHSYVSSLLKEILNTTTLSEAIEIIDRTITEKATPEMLNATIANIQQINPFLYKQIKNINESNDLYSSIIIYLESVVIYELSKTASSLGIDLNYLFSFINKEFKNSTSSIDLKLNKTETSTNTQISSIFSKTSIFGIFERIIEKIFELLK